MARKITKDHWVVAEGDIKKVEGRWFAYTVAGTEGGPFASRVDAEAWLWRINRGRIRG